MEKPEVALQLPFIEKQVAVKLIIISCLLLSIPFHTFCQKLKGKYILHKEYKDEEVHYLDINNGFFTDKSHSHIDSTVGQGNVVINGRTLIFTYTDVPDQDSSYYRIHKSSHAVGKDTAIINFEVAFENFDPAYANIYNLDSNLNVLSKFTTNKSGKLALILLNDNRVKYTRLLTFAYFPLSFKLENLWGSENNIYVVLNPKTINYTLPKIDRFQIKRFEKDLLILSNEENQKIILKKISISEH
jgi:hypothetical protein